ncbi:cytochrome c oxidase subunit 6A2, mitochondrial-like [Dermacentor andersoni]|uniref:cytochrome c oxidase subunit 6A2, mitochondrial-like n=1 Tax=Dermacentor andersoni TaxID=34620 RepID=UPI002155D791|nr:cytochrome c oxidase subunit 6A2, mitochondrial-like [Dermacentor andersoni]
MASLTLKQAFRNFSKSTARFAQQGGEHSHEAGELLWKRLSFFVAFPAIALCGINVYLAELEHKKHFHRPEYRPYEYLHIRTKKYPWGDGNRALFFNPKVNWVPGGYVE